MLKFRISFSLIFLICGFLSSWLFSQVKGLNNYNIFWVGLLPGLFFISCILICIYTLKFKVSALNAKKFTTFSFISYSAIFYLTLVSSYIAMFVGVFTGGIGAVLIYFSINSFIIKVEYSVKTIFLLGTVSFLSYFTILMCFSYFLEYETSDEIYTTFAPTFCIWQIVIGLKLTSDLLRIKQKLLS